MSENTAPAVDLEQAEAEVDLPQIGARDRYDALMQVVRNRVTVRKFDAEFAVPDEHYDLILEAARHGPSGANAQPWHFVIVRDQAVKNAITDYFVTEQRFRAKAKMKFPTPDYRGLATAPGFVVVCSDMRWVNAFPVLNDGSDLDRMYKENAERILLQSVAAATMSAHLAAAALGYNVWWVTAIGQENAQKAMKPLLGIPDELSVLDIFLFGPPAQKPYKRWRKPLEEITNRDRFEAGHFMTDEELDDWIRNRRHRVMYKDASKID
ncbi:nitroreductase family protein [Hoeflea poritis]|uniref:Nitroreductase family protein n=1 Tax=Hoeflea poritis TaxID=2993659 RepID=A0ABT4VLQ4_9HYPH|nr:nitroreductase family protein [Hoeflea poritis]MDA4845590.1 nitroreductase family protein [Hoeflea poritis]